MKGEHYHTFIYNQAEYVEKIGIKNQDNHKKPYWSVVRFCPDCKKLEILELIRD